MAYTQGELDLGAEQTHAAFALMVHRAPSPTALAFWSGKIASQQIAVADLLMTLYNSVEFQVDNSRPVPNLENLEATTPEEFCWWAMTRFLQRDPTSGEVTAWTDDLATQARSVVFRARVLDVAEFGTRWPVLACTPADLVADVVPQRCMHAPEVVDLLDYLMPETLPQRRDGWRTTKDYQPLVEQNHATSWLVRDDQYLYAIKWLNPNVGFEIYRWDQTSVYLHEDHSSNDTPYILTPGRWGSRSMAIGAYDYVIGTIAQLDSGCVGGSSAWSYLLELAWHDPAFDAGGEVGEVDAVGLRYSYGPGTYELHVYGLGLGLVQHRKYLTHRLYRDALFVDAAPPPVEYWQVVGAECSEVPPCQ